MATLKEIRIRNWNLFFLNLEYRFSWYTDHTLAGLTITKKDGRWLLVVKATTPKGKGVVAFFDGKDLDTVVDQFIYHLSHKPGISWKNDYFVK